MHSKPILINYTVVDSNHSMETWATPVNPGLIIFTIATSYNESSAGNVPTQSFLPDGVIDCDKDLKPFIRSKPESGEYAEGPEYEAKLKEIYARAEQ